MRIYIIGQSGSGKSWMARKLSQRLHIPHIQMDLIWLEAGGVHTYGPGKSFLPGDVRKKIIAITTQKMSQKSWVLDGNYRTTIQPMALRNAEVVIMMDAPFWRRLGNNFARHFSGEDHRRGFTTRHFLLKHLPRFFRKGNQSRAGQLKTARAHRAHYLVSSRKQAQQLIDRLAKGVA